MPERTSPNPASEPIKGLRERRCDNQALRSPARSGGSRAKIADVLGLDGVENSGEPGLARRRERMRNEMPMGRGMG